MAEPTAKVAETMASVYLPLKKTITETPANATVKRSKTTQQPYKNLYANIVLLFRMSLNVYRKAVTIQMVIKASVKKASSV